MNFNLVSKNNVGIVGTLILAIFLSQSRSMDFLFRTALGRLVLIVLILAMSYTNKILGVVGVLFIIVMFSSSNITFMEGLDNMDATTTPDAVIDTTTTDTITTDTTTTDTPSTTTPATTAGATAKKAKQVVGTPIDESQTGVTETEDTTTTTEDITTEDAGDNINTTENAGVESFDIIGLERNIQKGKNSNSIPINNNNYDDNVLPTDFINKLGFSLF